MSPIIKILLVLALVPASSAAPIMEGITPTPYEDENSTSVGLVQIYGSPEDMERGVDPFFECPLGRDEAERTLMRALEILGKGAIRNAE